MTVSTRSIRALAPLLLVVLAGCSAPAPATPPSDRTGESLAGSDEPPVALNANSPVTYPSSLGRERIEGTVLVRLFVDERGTVVRDSMRIAESSGYPALDTAALEGARDLRFAPALRRGTPVATAFLQPVHFRTPAPAATP